MNLTVQLLLFVVWMLFPVFYAGYCLMERNVIEKQAAAMSELKIKMERLANSFDSSLELYKTWVCERISNALETTLAFYDGHNYQHEKEFLENMLRDFNARLLKEGVYSKNVFMLDSAFQVRSIFTGADDKQMKLFQRFFTSIYTSHLSGASMRKNKERLGSDILTGAQTEELLNIARTLLSAEVISNMSMKKESLERLEGFGDSAYIYHKYYNTQNDKRSILHVGIYKPALQRICMIDWLDCFFDSDLRGIEWLVVNRSKPSWFHRYPFWKTHTQGKMGLLYPILDFIPPQLAFFSHVSANADESFTAQVEYDGHKYLFTCLPGHNMGDYIIALLLPLEGYFTRIDSFRRRIWFAMGLIFLLCTIIGAWLAAGFINPIKLFAKKAIAVTKSEFDQKLESEGQDMEISLLAKSFNKVIANLREGRTLKKFVSETTLEVLPHISRTKSCPEKIRAVVLFISLDNFWKASIELGPKQAVVQLNDFFAQVCMLLHETGGDVSKFIGEKVMAVFKISDPESEAEVALQVVKFVEKLQKKHQEDNTCLKNMKLKIGIAAGEILAGIIGGDKTRLEQTVIGDKVNLAARLCSFSSSETALTDETFAAIVAAINKPGLMVKKLPDQRIKGKKNMVSVFCLRTKKEKILS
jgi:adenylate cyclase